VPECHSSDVFLPPAKSGSCAGLFCVESLQVIADVVLELSDQKTQGFIILISLKWLFSKYACKLFSEMTMRI
jgi:hypothetical protein